MRQKRARIVDDAIHSVEGFAKVFKVIHQNTVLKGQSKSTFENYLRRISLISLHFGRLPEDITDDEIREYLTALALSCQSPSRSSFKHMVYGLRYYFRHIGQNLSLHPHIHCLVPAAGITLSGSMKKISKKGKYLYPVKKLSIDFRGILMKRLKKQLEKRGKLPEYQTAIDHAWSKKWVVYCEPSFSDAEHVIRYLGQYTHRVAISNHRIQNIDKEQNTVSFHYKDYRDHGKQKLTTLTGVEFLRRFCLHILPKGFVKIRYYGILSNRYARQTAMYRKPKQNRSKETVQQLLKRLTGFDVYMSLV